MAKKTVRNTLGNTVVATLETIEATAVLSKGIVEVAQLELDAYKAERIAEIAEDAIDTATATKE